LIFHIPKYLPIGLTRSIYLVLPL